jgi:carboxylate-amine ligase
VNDEPALHLFDGYGIEIEYMIVDTESLSVRPEADELLAAVGGGYEFEVELGPIAWSNELVLHVVELKTNGPSRSLAGLGALFQEHVGRVNALLEPRGACLLPSAMHPWMDPYAELALWPHESRDIYATFDRIFDCHGHGWANLQSMHVNLPFQGDDEFARLHAAIRMVLPILPALAASSPIVDGRTTGLCDTRLDLYRDNARRVPSVTGRVIPENMASRAEYEGVLLQGIYDEIAPLDPEGILRHEWLNARGCIARFDRMAIEIRTLDTQEHPRADLAVAAAVTALVRLLVEERTCDHARQRSWPLEDLCEILHACVRDADECMIGDRDYLRALGWPEQGTARARDLWRHLLEQTLATEPDYAEWAPALDVIVSHGCLARRIARAAGTDPDHDALRAVYAELAQCLARGTSFVPEP